MNTDCIAPFKFIEPPTRIYEVILTFWVSSRDFRLIEACYARVTYIRVKEDTDAT